MGVYDTYYPYDPYNPPANYNIIKGTQQLAKKGIFGRMLDASGKALNWATESTPPGFIAMGLITLIGGIIGGITQKKPGLTPEQKYFKDMTNYYYKLGQRSKYANSYKRMMSPNSIPASKVTNINYEDLVNRFPYKGEV